MVRGSRSWLIGTLVGVACLIVAPNAFAIVDTVNLTRFSKTVSGNTPGFVGTVTVDLLRNSQATDGTIVRQQVDTFTALVDGSFHWSGAFAKHAFSTRDDQVEVNYNGTPARERLTIGAGRFLPSSSVPGVAHTIAAPADRLDGLLGIASDGTTMRISSSCSCNPVTATVNGVAAPFPVGGKITFASPVSNADTIVVTGSFSSLGTVAELTDAAPLLTPLPADTTPPYTSSWRAPECDFYLNTSEVVCHQLPPGSYSLVHRRGAAALATQTLTVPARLAVGELIPSQAASTPVANVAAGDQFTLTVGSHLLTTLTVNPFAINRLDAYAQVSDPPVTVSGTCTPQMFFNVNFALCSDGTVPQPSFLGGASVSLGTGSVSIGGSDDLGQLDDTSGGGTEIDMPSVAFNVPGAEHSVRTPFVVLAIARYNEPRALVINENSRPANGPTLTSASTTSNAPVDVSIAPLGSGSFRSLGNANRPGGIVVSTLAPGIYVERFTLRDARGDANAFDDEFVVQAGSAAAPTVASCKTRTSSRHGKVVAVRLTCASPNSGARVAVWLQRRSTVLADGVGTVQHGAAKITLTGSFRRGAYKLVELIVAAGAASQSTHPLKLK